MERMAAVNDPGAGAPRAPLPPDAGVIRSKILPTRLPAGAVTRPRLVERLGDGRGCSLTLVSAPAGYGKTTLLTAWLASPSAPRGAWVSLDRRDTDPVRLWTHVIVALQRVEPRAGTASLAALRACPDQIEEQVLPVLLEELSGEGPDLVVVLDDYHLAQNSAVDATFEAFIRYQRIACSSSSRLDPTRGWGSPG